MNMNAAQLDECKESFKQGLIQWLATVFWGFLFVTGMLVATDPGLWL